MNRSIFSILILLSFLFSGCLLFQPSKSVVRTIEDIEKKYNISFDTLTSHIGKTTVEGGIRGLSTDSSRIRLEKALGNVLLQFRDSVSVILSQSLDTILSDDNKEWINILAGDLGKVIRIELGEIMDDPVGTKADLILANLIKRLSSDETKSGLSSLTDSVIRVAVISALDEFDKNYDKKIGSNINRTLLQLDSVAQRSLDGVDTTVQKSISDFKGLAWTLGVIALLLLLVAGYFYVMGKRNKDTLKIVTQEIDKIPDQQIYDKLSKSITKGTVDKGLEPHLVKILKEQNLYQQPYWDKKNQRLLELLKDKVNKSGKDQTVQQLIKSLKKDVANTDLIEQLNSMLPKNDES